MTNGKGELKYTKDKLIVESNTRVIISPLTPCLKCYYCYLNQYNLCINLKELGSTINGGFAEYIELPYSTVKINGIIPISNKLNDEEAALIEPLACCLNNLTMIDPFLQDKLYKDIENEFKLLQTPLKQTIKNSTNSTLTKNTFKYTSKNNNNNNINNINNNNNSNFNNYNYNNRQNERFIYGYSISDCLFYVVIIGDGPIALMHLQLLKKFYDNVYVIIIGGITHRLQKAKNMGADRIICYSIEELSNFRKKF